MVPALDQLPRALIVVGDSTAVGKRVGANVALVGLTLPVVDGPPQLARTRKRGTHQHFTLM
jgi:hypothetical protein